MKEDHRHQKPEEEPKPAELLLAGVPGDKRVLSIISVGYPAESRKSSRRDLKELVFKDRYGESG